MRHILLLLCCILFAPTTWALNVQESQVASSKVFLVEDTAYPVVAVAISAEHSGFLSDPAGKEGRTMLALYLLEEHINKHRNDLIQLGIKNLFASSSLTHFNVSFMAPKQNLEKGLELVQRLVVATKVDQRVFRSKKNKITASIFNAETGGANFFLLRKGMQQVFPGHPWSRYFGDYDSVESLNLTDYDLFWKNLFTKTNLTFAFAGDISLPTARDLAGKFRTRSAKNTLTQTPFENPTPILTGETTTLHVERPQSHVLFLHDGLNQNHQDYYKALILTAIIGGNALTSRLFDELRDQRGIVYSVSFMPLKEVGLLNGFFSTANETCAEAIGVTKKVFEGVQAKGVTAKELASAKNQVIGGMLTNLLSLTGIAAQLIDNAESGLPNKAFLDNFMSRVESLTLAEINQFAHEFLKPENLQFVIVGNPVMGGIPDHS